MYKNLENQSEIKYTQLGTTLNQLVYSLLARRNIGWKISDENRELTVIISQWMTKRTTNLSVETGVSVRLKTEPVCTQMVENGKKCGNI